MNEWMKKFIILSLHLLWMIIVVVVYSLNLKHGDFYNDMSIECNAMLI